MKGWPASVRIARSHPSVAGVLRACVGVLCLLASVAGHAANDFNTRFVAIAFHDVVDRSSELDDDAVTVDRLIAFLEWLRGNGWQAISLDDVERAGRGEQPLPAKAVLLTFDDGYRSLYTRVFPLLRAYRVPAVSALVGDWVAAPPGSMVRYGSRDMPRERFVSWAEAREMQRSGLVEFALHSHSLHQEVLANPQGNTMPAASTRRYTPRSGYESADEFARRVHDDLARGRALLQRELGRAPRTLAWPFGRYNAIGVRAARELGFTHLLTLDVGPADARHPLAIDRYFPTHNPALSELAANLQPNPVAARTERLICLDPAAFATGDAAADDGRLGRAIDRIRALGVTGVVVDAAQRDAHDRIVAAWFPSRELPLAGDVLSRIAWQLQTRAGVEVYARLPHRAAAATLGGDASRVLRLYEDLGAMVPLSGWVLEDGSAMLSAQPHDDAGAQLATTSLAPRSWADWVVASRRRAQLERLQQPGSGDALAWQAYARLAAARPGLRLLWMASAPSTVETIAPHPLAESTFLPQALDSADASVQAAVDPRVGRWFTSAQPVDAQRLVDAALAHQRGGGVALGWCRDDALTDHPPAAVVSPAVSAATFPLRP